MDTPPATTRISPRKLLLSKWTAVEPRDREKHFIVTRLGDPVGPGATPVQVELEAVHSRRSRWLDWRELTDTARWLPGWR